MSQPKLVIKKGMFNIQGKVRACCNIHATVPADLRTKLEEHFLNEPLFKRAAYAASWPENALAIPAALAPHVSALLKNDACPEITVKTILAGQLFQGAGVWEMMSFEFVAKLAFDNFTALLEAVAEMGTDVTYQGTAAKLKDLESFSADTTAEVRALSKAAPDRGGLAA